MNNEEILKEVLPKSDGYITPYTIEKVRKTIALTREAERKRILEILKDFWFLDYYKNATFLKGSFMKEFKKEVLKDD